MLPNRKPGCETSLSINIEPTLISCSVVEPRLNLNSGSAGRQTECSNLLWVILPQPPKSCLVPLWGWRKTGVLVLRSGLEEGGDLRAYNIDVWWREKWRGCDGRGGRRCVKLEGDSPRVSGVHVAKDRLLMQRKYTAWLAAALNKGTDTFIILITRIWMINGLLGLIEGVSSNEPLKFPQEREHLIHQNFPQVCFVWAGKFGKITHHQTSQSIRNNKGLFKNLFYSIVLHCFSSSKLNNRAFKQEAGSHLKYPYLFHF